MPLLGHDPATPASVNQQTAPKQGFIPNPANAKEGELVRSTIAALDHDHGFNLGAFSSDRLLRKGRTISAEFSTDRAGAFHYSPSCGHTETKARLVVEEKAKRDGSRFRENVSSG